MISGMVITLLALATAFYLVRPLFTVPDPTPEAIGRQEHDELATRQASIFATLQDLEFDLVTGKISEEDHRELKERYTAEAVDLMQKMDAKGVRPPPHA